MKADASPLSAYIARILKLTGSILILGTIVDCLLLMIPPNFMDNEWLSSLIREWVNRGVLPLIGVAVLLLGVWAAPHQKETSGKKKPGQGWVTGAIGLAMSLGILFLLAAPLYFNSSRLASADATRQINDQAAQAQQQLNTQLAQRQAQVKALLSNPEQVDQLQTALANASSSGDQKAELQQIQDLLKQAQNDPKVIDQQVATARQAGTEQIQQQQQQARDQLTLNTRKLRIHTILTSLLLAIGYLLVAWTGISSPKPKLTRQKAR
ncbi:MAG TPA: HpsJ family protein [Trichocoleus sp.]